MKKFAFLLLWLVSFELQAQRLQEPNYGMVINGNFSTINSSFGKYVGSSYTSYGVFFQNPFTPYHSNSFLNRLDYTSEIAMSTVGFRDKNSDKKFKSKYIDLSFYVNYVPDRMSDDLRLFIGVRPSYLTYTSTSLMEFGTYRELGSDTQNINIRGDIDLCAMAGLTINMGDVASFEMKYVHSFTNASTAQYYKGKPSTIEVGIRLSAVRIRNKLIGNDQNQVKELNNRAQGTLLVMLEEPDEKLIAQLIQEEKLTDANYVRKLQEQTNLNIIKEFRANFDFCKVEFFMNSNANKVNRGDFKGVFVDDQLLAKTDVSFDTTNYMIGSFIEDVSAYSRTPDYALYFYDAHFVQLGAPYNTGINSMGIFVGGDPMNYFRRVKTSGYYPEDFRKIIKKVNSKLQLGRISD
jgi:hypothetical protein